MILGVDYYWIDKDNLVVRCGKLHSKSSAFSGRLWLRGAGGTIDVDFAELSFTEKEAKQKLRRLIRARIADHRDTVKLNRRKIEYLRKQLP